MPAGVLDMCGVDTVVSGVDEPVCGVSSVMTASELDVCGCDSVVSDESGNSSGVEVVVSKSSTPPFHPTHKMFSHFLTFRRRLPVRGSGSCRYLSIFLDQWPIPPSCSMLSGPF